MALTQASFRTGTAARAKLFEHVAAVLNGLCQAPEFEVQDDQTGPLIRHAPTEVRLGVRPSLPANPEKPFDIWVRLTHRFPMRADGTFNSLLVLQRVNEVAELKLPEVP